MSTRLYLSPILALLLSLTNMTASASEIEIDRAWIRPAPPTVRVMAAYMNIINHGSARHTLRGASSPQFESVEIHRSEMAGGMMHMKPVTKIELEQHETVAFKPGGYHLMLIGPHKPLRRGDHVTLILNFDGGVKVETVVEVKDGEEAMTDNPSHHHH